MLEETMPLPPEGRASRRSDSSETVPIKGIKDLVAKHLPANHPLRLVILAEKSRLTPQELLHKWEIWYALLEYKS